MSQFDRYTELIDRHLQDMGQTPTRPAAVGESPTRKANKYRNKKTEIDGRTFDSKKEANRYLDLREQQRAGLITDLRCQVGINLMVNGQVIGVYVCDFLYYRGRKQVIEDVKGMRTDVYKLKRKILAANGITIQEV